MEGIRNSAVYARESETGYLPGLYYLVSWKGYPEDKSTWKPALVVQYLQKLVSTFHKDHPNKLTATSLPIDLASPMAKRTGFFNINGKRKCG